MAKHLNIPEVGDDQLTAAQAVANEVNDIDIPVLIEQVSTPYKLCVILSDEKAAAYGLDDLSATDNEYWVYTNIAGDDNIISIPDDLDINNIEKVINLRENADTGRILDIENDDYQTLMFLAETISGVQWVIDPGSGGAGVVNNPAQLYATYPGVETAQTDTWDIESQVEGEDGVEIPIVSRVVYNSAGDSILYGFYRILTVSSTGATSLVSAETRYEIDDPTACV